MADTHITILRLRSYRNDLKPLYYYDALRANEYDIEFFSCSFPTHDIKVGDFISKEPLMTLIEEIKIG